MGRDTGPRQLGLEALVRCPRTQAPVATLTKGRGCVSGSQLLNLREECEKGDDYDFDMIDGYDELKCV